MFEEEKNKSYFAQQLIIFNTVIFQSNIFITLILKENMISMEIIWDKVVVNKKEENT